MISSQIMAFSADCPTVTVTNVTHGGRYFYADNDELKALFGINRKLWGDKMEVVVREAWKIKEGWKIIAWKKDTDTEGHGRKDPSGCAIAGNWKVGDKIMSKACYIGIYLMSFV